MSISRARTDSTGPVPGWEAMRVSAQPAEGPLPGASSRGALGSPARPRGSAPGRGEAAARAAGTACWLPHPPRLPARRESNGGGPEVPALRLGVAAAGGRGPQECCFHLGLGRKFPPGRSRLHTPNLAQDTGGRQGLGLPERTLTVRVPPAEGAGGERRGPGRGRGPGGGAKRSLGRGEGGGERSIAGSGLGAELAPRGRVQSDPKLGRTRCRWAAGKNTSLSQG